MSLRDTIGRPVHTRPCAVAGRFYPAEPGKLHRDIDRYLNDASQRPGAAIPPSNSPIRAIIAPHAGYVYSAPVAASAYRWVSTLSGRIRRVVLIGPSHYVGFPGLACSSASAFETPFGDVPVDMDSNQRLLHDNRVCCHDEAHAPEHGLEVHLPLLIHTLCGTPRAGDTYDVLPFSIVPLLFGDVGHESVAQALETFMDDPATLVVVSSDLSHYHDYATAKQIDRDTADAIVAKRGDRVTPDRACGHVAVCALLHCAEARGLDVIEVDLHNSGDTAGPRDQVVGYGAFILR